MMSCEKTRVLLFCGGRGSKTLINELLRRTDVDLTLMVNAYDDGLSTGALRRFIPGMLGPSDFRKNLSYLLDLYSAEQYALQQLVEYRLPLDFSAKDLSDFRSFIDTGSSNLLKQPLRDFFDRIGTVKAKSIRRYLKIFFDYYDQQDDKTPIEFPDCSVGNLLFAGLYLDVGKDFNRTIAALGKLGDIQANLVNVSRGEGYTLVGIKTDGQLLVSEGRIVGEQSAVPIMDTFFIQEPPREGWDDLAAKSIQEKLAWFKEHELHPAVSPEAIEALATADVIIYGPGTQHSSLLPSYRIAHEAIAKSPAKIKAFVANLGHDHDIQALDAPALVDKALTYLHDPENTHAVITHILYQDGSNLGDSVSFPASIARCGSYKNAKLVFGSFSNPIKQNAHNGHTTIGAVLNLLECVQLGDKPTLHISIDLLKRSEAAEAVLQEAIELNWNERLSSVCIHFPKHSLAGQPKLPSYITTVVDEQDRQLDESLAILNWLNQDPKANYLATLSGDGGYSLADILKAIHLLQSSRFAVVLGSRTQSRRQFLKSLRSAYGEGGLFYRIGWLGAFTITALFGLRFGMIFSDPLTGFRIYRKDRLPAGLSEAIRQKPTMSPIAIMRFLLKNGTEIAEMPISYRTFSGFTHPWWRLRRGINSLISFFR